MLRGVPRCCVMLCGVPRAARVPLVWCCAVSLVLPVLRDAQWCSAGVARCSRCPVVLWCCAVFAVLRDVYDAENSRDFSSVHVF
jgi:hypothetical protein